MPRICSFSAWAAVRKRRQADAAFLLTFVPDIGCELPVASDLFPHHDVLSGNYLPLRVLGCETERSDLARCGGPKRLDVEGRHFRIADFFRHAFPHCLDCRPALYHARPWRKCGRVLGVERCDAGEITLVEEIHPFRIHSLDLALLGEDRRGQAGGEGNHQCDFEHESWLPAWRKCLRFSKCATTRERVDTPWRVHSLPCQNLEVSAG